MCAEHCVVWSRSAAAISARPLLDFSFQAGTHCSPAFPNLRGIPPAGNIVYNRRQQAWMLAPTLSSLHRCLDYSTMEAREVRVGVCPSLIWPLHRWKFSNAGQSDESLQYGHSSQWGPLWSSSLMLPRTSPDDKTVDNNDSLSPPLNVLRFLSHPNHQKKKNRLSKVILCSQGPYLTQPSRHSWVGTEFPCRDPQSVFEMNPTSSTTYKEEMEEERQHSSNNLLLPPTHQWDRGHSSPPPSLQRCHF